MTVPPDPPAAVTAADEAAATAPGPARSEGGVFSPGRRMLTGGLVSIITLVAFEALAIATVMPLVEDDLGDLWLYGWVFSSFFLGNLIGIVVAGSAADRMRPAIPFAAGLVVFSAGLVVGGLAPTMLVLVLGRALQGLGAGAMPAIAYVCIGRGYPPGQRPTVFALISSAWVVPSMIGPFLAGVIGEAVGWRWVLLGLLPLCGAIGALAIAGVWSIPGPAELGDTSGSLTHLGRAVLVAGGSALVLAGLGSGSPLVGVALVAVGVALGLPALRRLLPPGTLVARPGLPATVLVRGVLTFAFFAGDAYVPFALVEERGLSAPVAGLALTSASLTWTCGAWLQARFIQRVGASKLVVIGMLAVVVGSAAMLLVLAPAVPPFIGMVAWAIGGFGIGLAYSPLSVVTLSEAAEGQEGRATSSLQLSDTLGTALGTGMAGVLVALGEAVADSDTAGLVGVFVLGAAAAVAGAALARRVPGKVAPAVT